MSDIVERLRQPFQYSIAGGVVPIHPSGPVEDLLEEAADEIEQLRGLVEIAPAADLWMRSPSDGKLEQISDEHHSVGRREEFRETYLAAGWTDPQLHARRRPRK